MGDTFLPNLVYLNVHLSISDQSASFNREKEINTGLIGGGCSHFWYIFIRSQ